MIGVVLSLSSFIYGPTDPSVSAILPSSYFHIISEGLSDKALFEAVEGYSLLKETEDLEKEMLIIIDYTKSSNLERFYVIDMKDTSLTKSLLVAHGKNSGDEFANSFSNRKGSYQSSLGFFKTAETYEGKHGLSLRLDGLEKGINHLARERAIVIHQADYVSLDFAAEHGRIGRSLGCPALPSKQYAQVIESIKEGCLLYIYGGTEGYSSMSSLLQEN
ncbi:MAG: murein L,D-transpeptidase catalytic domain family protein [Flavobacteriales bacterium]|nr:murein L,D-transpeptidase catalytic domain family protein [Flavobacteriales bacterium]